MKNISLQSLEAQIASLKDDFGFQLEAFELEAQGRDFFKESLQNAQAILANPSLLKRDKYGVKTYFFSGQVVYRACESFDETPPTHFDEEIAETTVFAFQQGAVHVVQVFTECIPRYGRRSNKMETFFLFEGNTWVCLYNLPKLTDCSVTKSDKDGVILLLSFYGGETESYCFS